jgi:hypothetical protein
MKWRVPIGAAVVVAIGYMLQLLKKSSKAPRPENTHQRSIPAAWIKEEKS